MLRFLDADGRFGPQVSILPAAALVYSFHNPHRPTLDKFVTPGYYVNMGKIRLPEFTNDGLLPPGDYVLTLAELAESVLVTGPQQTRRSETWDGNWRKQLVDNLEVLVRQLWQVGITEIFVDGSFAEDKDHPNDIDGYFECDLRRLASGELERDLNLLDPHKIWTWDPVSRRPYRGYPKKQLPMWHAYRVEFYPHVGQFSGIRDRFGNELEFPSAFRLSRRNGEPRGIIKIEG